MGFLSCLMTLGHWPHMCPGTEFLIRFAARPWSEWYYLMNQFTHKFTAWKRHPSLAHFSAAACNSFTFLPKEMVHNRFEQMLGVWQHGEGYSFSKFGVISCLVIRIMPSMCSQTYLTSDSALNPSWALLTYLLVLMASLLNPWCSESNLVNMHRQIWFGPKIAPSF